MRGVVSVSTSSEDLSGTIVKQGVSGTEGLVHKSRNFRFCDGRRNFEEWVATGRQGLGLKGVRRIVREFDEKFFHFIAPL